VDREIQDIPFVIDLSKELSFCRVAVWVVDREKETVFGTWRCLGFIAGVPGRGRGDCGSHGERDPFLSQVLIGLTAKNKASTARF